ncbi:MAG: hypothetical protein WC897_04215 [Candidatus Gracilibacteria bacterium]
MKRILITLGFLLLTACGSVANTDTPTGGEYLTYTYKTTEFTITAPEDWTVYDTFTSEYPDGMRVAFKNNMKDSDFTANVSVVKEDNPKNLTSYDLSQEKIASHKESLLNYVLVAQEEILIGAPGGETRTLFNQFTGKNTSSGPTLNFIQMTVAKADNSWTVTASYREGEDEFVIAKLLATVKSFTLK